MGTKPEAPAKAFRPSPRENLIAGGDQPMNHYESTSRSSHAHPGRSPREIRNVRSNAPSEPDHPLFGLLDPMRKHRVGPTGESLASDMFRAPDISFYNMKSAEQPYPDKAHLATSFDHHAKMSRHITEAQSKFLWPAWNGRPMTCKRPPDTIGRLE